MSKSKEKQIVLKKWLVKFFQERIRTGRKWVPLSTNPNYTNPLVKSFYHNVILPSAKNYLVTKFGPDYPIKDGVVAHFLRKMLEGKSKILECKRIDQIEKEDSGEIIRSELAGLPYNAKCYTLAEHLVDENGKGIDPYSKFMNFKIGHWIALQAVLDRLITPQYYNLNSHWIIIPGGGNLKSSAVLLAEDFIDDYLKKWFKVAGVDIGTEFRDHCLSAVLWTISETILVKKEKSTVVFNIKQISELEKMINSRQNRNRRVHCWRNLIAYKTRLTKNQTAVIIGEIAQIISRMLDGSNPKPLINNFLNGLDGLTENKNTPDYFLPDNQSQTEKKIDSVIDRCEIKEYRQMTLAEFNAWVTKQVFKIKKEKEGAIK